MSANVISQRPEPVGRDAAVTAAAVQGQVAVKTVFQPIVSLSDEHVVGYEALSRWPDAVGVSPESVFALLQGYGYLGQPINGGDVPGPDVNRLRVVTQDPPARARVDRDVTITLNYGS